MDREERIKKKKKKMVISRFIESIWFSIKIYPVFLIAVFLFGGMIYGMSANEMIGWQAILIIAAVLDFGLVFAMASSGVDEEASEAVEAEMAEEASAVAWRDQVRRAERAPADEARREALAHQEGQRRLEEFIREQERRGNVSPSSPSPTKPTPPGRPVEVVLTKEEQARKDRLSRVHVVERRLLSAFDAYRQKHGIRSEDEAVARFRPHATATIQPWPDAFLLRESKDRLVVKILAGVSVPSGPG